MPFVPIGPEKTDAQYKQQMARALAENNPRKQLRIVQAEVIGGELARQYEDVLDFLQSNHVDVAVCHWMMLGARMATETSRVPTSTVCFNSMGLECVHGDAWRLPDIDVDRARRIGREMADMLWDDVVARFRESRGLPALASVSEYQYACPLNIVAVSRHLTVGQDGWDAHHKVTGFFFSEPGRDWRPDAELRDFVAHEKPLVFTFGSMPGVDPERTASILIECARILGKRAVLQTGWGGIAALAARSPDILVVGYVPHPWLFAHAACVVHHGGAGTCAEAIRAGVPSVIVPHMLDQSSWATILASRRLAPGGLAVNRLSAQGLATLIEQALADSTIADACANMSRLVEAEGGLAAAADLLEEFGAGDRASLTTP